MNRVEGKTAIVTGGAGGIGSVTAEFLAREGGNVVIADIDLERAEEIAHRIGSRAIGLKYDARDFDSINAMVTKAAGHFGGIDILHNNAALTDSIFELDLTLLDTSVEFFDKTLQINLRGMFLMSKATLPEILKRGGGSIINMGSASSERGSPKLIAYATSKGGVLSFTRSVATQHGRDNVRTNCILPGLILTPAAQAAWKVSSNPGKTIVPTLPHTRNGQAEDIAGLVVYLASDEAKFVNGAIITCDGGSSAGAALPNT